MAKEILRAISTGKLFHKTSGNSKLPKMEPRIPKT